MVTPSSGVISNNQQQELGRPGITINKGRHEKFTSYGHAMCFGFIILIVVAGIVIVAVLADGN
jgi:hypothetical protein